MKPLGFLERLLFGAAGLKKAEEAQKRLEEARRERALIRVDYDVLCAKLNAVVADAQGAAKKLNSDPPQLEVRMPTPSQLDDEEIEGTE